MLRKNWEGLVVGHAHPSLLVLNEMKYEYTTLIILQYLGGGTKLPRASNTDSVSLTFASPGDAFMSLSKASSAVLISDPGQQHGKF